MCIFYTREMNPKSIFTIFNIKNLNSVMEEEFDSLAGMPFLKDVTSIVDSL